MRLSIQILYATCAIAIPINTVRSGILGLADSGGEDSDQSLNGSMMTKMDSFLDSQDTTVTAELQTSGIDGVGTSEVRD